LSTLRRHAAELPGKMIGPDSEHDAGIPDCIEECRVTGLLGTGGQSVVYRAWHPRLNSEIAIKRLSSTAPSSDAVLIHEAMILSSVRSTAFPRPLDFRRVGDEMFLFLELIHGEPLADCGFVLSADEILNVLRQVLGALRELHGSQLLHLDLSPGNILVDENGNARLIDFGLARRLHDSQHHGVIPGGTPGFVSPELLDPKQAVDERADLYGIGAVLFFLLHGHPPQMKGIEGTPLRPELAADRLAIRLSALCERAVSFDRDLRFDSAEEFLTAVEELDGRRSRARRWLTAAALWGTVLLGQNERLLETAHAEVLVITGREEQRLENALPVHLGDHIAFSFDATAATADLIVRKPSGTLVRLRPFHRGLSGAFRFPPAGGAVLRQERGTYVVFFVAPKMSATADVLLRDLGDLPSPPALKAGESLVVSRAAAQRALWETRESSPAGDWRHAFLRCESRFPGLIAIAFPVE
jgi:hypothetical protein